MGIREFLQRAIEKIEGFRSNPRTLPLLARARHLLAPKDSVAGAQRIKGVNFGKKVQHVMHRQARDNTASILQWLVGHLDVRTRESVFVHPGRGIRRSPYIAELARAAGGICERTVQRSLASLARAGILLRTANSNRYFLSRELFKSLSLDVSYDRLVGQLAGLDKHKAQGGYRPKKKQPPAASVVSSLPAAHREFEKAPPSPAPNVELGNSYLDQLRSIRRIKPPG